MDIFEESLQCHKRLRGKLSVDVCEKINNKHTLSLLYSPGVSQPCLEIAKDPKKAYDYTIKGHTVAVVSNGSAVLGLGSIGALASVPVMEGKAALFKSFADIDAFPICLDTNDADEIIRTVELLAPVFGGINLEDIKAPECFYIEQELKKRLDIPVFHDDQHGTAIVVLAGLYNALKLVNKDISNVRVVINGMGAAGCAIAKLLIQAGLRHITLCDRHGIIFDGNCQELEINSLHLEVDRLKNGKVTLGSLQDALVDADVFVGVSVPEIVSIEMAQSMNKDAIVFALANPIPEIMPDLAKQAGVRIIATGRSDFPNQVNNVLVFPGIFKGALLSQVSQITDEMKLIAAKALSSLVSDDELNEGYILPDAFDQRVVVAISQAIIKNI